MLDQDIPDVTHLFPRPFHRPEWQPRPVTKTQLVGFCDWISIYQRHDPAQGLKRLSDGAFLSIDQDGQVKSTTLKKLQIEGSHETRLFVRCDGETVWFEGNVSRYGRPDNVFGYSFRDCINKINHLMLDFGLPVFTEGERFISNWKGNPRSVWTGAIVTRIDLTENFQTGSRDDAIAFMRWLQGQQVSRLKTGVYGDHETVDFGRGSRRVYSKAYLKSAEIRRHMDKKGRNQYLEQLAQWCDDVGLIRFETTYKSTKLHDLRCHYLGGFDMKQLEIYFEERKEVLSRTSAELNDFSALPNHILATLRMWEAGDNLAKKLKRSQFYVHRKALLPYGVDIAVKSNIVKFQPKTRVIKLGPVLQPDWYELPPIERKRYGNGC